MEAERWRRLRTLFGAAAELDPDDWAGYLDRACPDDAELRGEVGSLLRRDMAPGESLGDAVRRAAPDARAERLPRLRTGQRLGHYHVVEEIGAGGMGVVYRARDTTLGRVATG